MIGKAWLTRGWRLVCALSRLPWKVRQLFRDAQESLAQIQRLGQHVQQLECTIRDANAVQQVLEEMSEIKTHLQELAEVKKAIRELREYAYCLEHLVRTERRIQAKDALQARLPQPGPRQDGLSILIPCWNQGGFLEASITSALATLDQLGAPGEILVLDDASRDETLAIATRLTSQEPRIRVLSSEGNLGLAGARNVMLWQARYHHAMMLDADNQLVPDGMAQLYAAACQTGAVLTYGIILAHQPDGQVQWLCGHRRVSPALFEENTIDAMAMVRVADVLQLGGYDLDTVALEDWELGLRLLRLRRLMIHVPVVIGRYRMCSLSMIRDAEHQLRHHRLVRRYALDGPPSAESLHAGIYHPATGYLWRSPALHDSPVERVPATPSPRRMLVVSSAGVRNHGDDALLLATLERLRKLRPECVPVVVSDGPDIPNLGTLGLWAGTCRELVRGLSLAMLRRGTVGHPDLLEHFAREFGLGDNLEQHQPDGLFTESELAQFEHVLIHGGGNLTHHWPYLVDWRTAIAAAARAVGVPFLVSGQGVGPLIPELLPLVRFLVMEASAFCVRDPLSAEYLRAVGIDRDVPVVGDDALGLESVRLSPALSQRRVLGFQVRLADYVGFSREELQVWANTIDALAARLGADILGLPINTQLAINEPAMMRQLGSVAARRVCWHIHDATQNVRELRAMVQECVAVVSCSYHLALFALEGGVPAIVLARGEYYQRKAEGLRELFQVCAPVVADIGWSLDELVNVIARQRCSPGPVATVGRVDHWLRQQLARAVRAAAAA